MRTLAALLLGTILLADAPALAQPQPQGGRQFQKQGLQPGGGRMQRLERDEMKGRGMPRERFSREERDRLRQDLLDANREMKGRR